MSLKNIIVILKGKSKNYSFHSNLIGWYKQDRKSAKNLDLKYDDEKLEDLPYFIKNSSQLDIEKILKDIKEVNFLKIIKN